MGNSIAANMFMVGYAFQQGALPLAAESIEKAIEMNGEAVAMNQAAFRWGRRAALDISGIETLIPKSASVDDNRRLSQTLDEIVERVAFLTG
jgi:indolepyruvate ferredoxin oxidoreductase